MDSAALGGSHGYMDEIVSVLHDLKEEVNRKNGFREDPENSGFHEPSAA